MDNKIENDVDTAIEGSGFIWGMFELRCGGLNFHA